ncbi:ANTAR domain-containing protein [Cellulomonas phragmiteti]|uniref:ANTAR domain-containing protein n=1 Tax=Cellulomonas phragmiteti TaxID=478780 RepID=A0ABQ4DNB8_9CELL|nr:ANTAR domain-containing protein [Cellulomonas phragmiteti]GIG40835.1 hypothetical protein Cph01nite_25970 [Cellulomonas phragmiteti]
MLTSVAARTDAAVDWSQVTAELGTTAALLAAMVADRVALDDLRQDVDDLTAAMRTRAVIDQAIGVVMASRRCTPAQALDTLRTASQHHNEKVSAVAARVVGRVAGRPVPPPEPFLPRRRTPGRSSAPA